MLIGNEGENFMVYVIKKI